MITLTDEQQHIHDSILDAVCNYNGRYECLVTGYAGTGKSTLTSEMVNTLNEAGYSIMVTSPTHKANSVLRNMLENKLSEDLDICTIHSFLGLKLVYDKEVQKLEHDPKSTNANKMVDVLIIDECSMISDELLAYIQQQAYRVRRAIIFIGDKDQVEPVDTEHLTGETKLSKVFDIVNFKYMLKTVLRQALNNPIIRLATLIRESIGTTNDPLHILRTFISNNPEVEEIINIDDPHTFLQLYTDHINSNDMEEIYNNACMNKIIAYTNYRVDNANMYVRNHLFPSHTDVEFVKGEPVVFEVVTQNNDYTVQSIVQSPDATLTDYLGIPCWSMKFGSNTLLAVGPYTKEIYNEHMKQLAFKIRNNEIDPKTDLPYSWGDYYLIKEKINVLNYPYATTIHKSQGSTFDNIWFDTDVLNKIRDHDTKCRLIYTALTRPKHMVLYK